MKPHVRADRVQFIAATRLLTVQLGSRQTDHLRHPSGSLLKLTDVLFLHIANKLLNYLSVAQNKSLSTPSILKARRLAAL